MEIGSEVAGIEKATSSFDFAANEPLELLLLKSEYSKPGGLTIAFGREPEFNKPKNVADDCQIAIIDTPGISISRRSTLVINGQTVSLNTTNKTTYFERNDSNGWVKHESAVNLCDLVNGNYRVIMGNGGDQVVIGLGCDHHSRMLLIVDKLRSVPVVDDVRSLKENGKIIDIEWGGVDDPDGVMQIAVGSNPGDPNADSNNLGCMRSQVIDDLRLRLPKINRDLEEFSRRIMVIKVDKNNKTVTIRQTRSYGGTHKRVVVKKTDGKCVLLNDQENYQIELPLDELDSFWLGYDGTMGYGNSEGAEYIFNLSATGITVTNKQTQTR